MPGDVMFIILYTLVHDLVTTMSVSSMLIWTLAAQGPRIPWYYKNIRDTFESSLVNRADSWPLSVLSFNMNSQIKKCKALMPFKAWSAHHYQHTIPSSSRAAHSSRAPLAVKQSTIVWLWWWFLFWIKYIYLLPLCTPYPHCSPCPCVCFSCLLSLKCQQCT